MQTSVVFMILVFGRLSVCAPRALLVFSAVVFRHGDRRSTITFPSDLNAESSDWNGTGMGQLTSVGKRQGYALGQFLRQRYDQHLLSPDYSEQDIHIRASDVDRVLETSYSVLAGLYPPTVNQMWHPTIAWQPIPVHTSSEWLDPELSVEARCPKFGRLLAELVALPETQVRIDRYRPLVDYIIQMARIPPSGDDWIDILNADMVHDKLYVDSLYNKSLPAWAARVYPNPAMEELHNMFILWSTYTDELTRLRIGYFFDDLLDRFEQKICGSMSPNLSAYLFGTHDVVLTWIMDAMGVYDRVAVPYTGALMFELYQGGNGPHLELMYRRYPNDLEAERLNIPGCGLKCPLSQFKKLMTRILPTDDFATACKI